MTATDPAVTHPAHYLAHPSGIEVIELTRLMPFGPGNALKYVLRHQHKGNPRQDLGKAEFYLRDCIEHGADWKPTPALAARARQMAAYEPNLFVQRVLRVLCTDAPLYASAVEWERRYGSALRSIAALKEGLPE